MSEFGVISFFSIQRRLFCCWNVLIQDNCRVRETSRIRLCRVIQRGLINRPSLQLSTAEHSVENGTKCEKWSADVPDVVPLFLCALKKCKIICVCKKIKSAQGQNSGPNLLQMSYHAKIPCWKKRQTDSIATFTHTHNIYIYMVKSQKVGLVQVSAHSKKKKKSIFIKLFVGI